MRDCRKFDKLLWVYPQITDTEKEDLEQHIAVCASCRSAMEVVSALRNSAMESEELAQSFDSERFDAAVMKKIRDLKRPLGRPEKVPDRYVLRLAFSFALAATVVLFLVKSISDLSEIHSPSTTAQKGEADNYGLINIELGRESAEQSGIAPPSPAQPQKSPVLFSEAPVEKNHGAPGAEKRPLELIAPPQILKDTTGVLSLEQSPESSKDSVKSSQMAIAPSDTGLGKYRQELNNLTAFAEQPTLPTVNEPPSIASKSLTADNAVHMRSGREQSDLKLSFSPEAAGGFSILPTPLASQAPDSVNIDAIYVTSENISTNQQTRAASISEIYKDTGSVQTQMPQSSILVTVEKMPKPLKLVLPEYPVWAGKQRLSGNLWVRARVESDGHISKAEIVSCDIKGVGFEDAALKAARESIFTPASSNGINLPVWIIYPVEFIYRE